MLKRRTIKIITAIICLLLAVSMLVTLFLPAFAEEATDFVDYETDTEAILELPVGSITDEYAAVKLTAEISLFEEEQMEPFLETYADHLPEGYAFDAIYYYAVVTAEDYPEFDASVGTIVSPSHFTNPTAIYLPLSDDQLNYKTVGVVAVAMLSGITMAETEHVTVDGKAYVKGEYESYGYLVLCHAVDENGEPILLQWYEKGFVGGVYDFLCNFWGLILLVAIGIIYIIWFFNPNRPKGTKKLNTESQDQPEQAEPSPETDSGKAEDAASPEETAEAAAPPADEPEETEKPKRKRAAKAKPESGEESATSAADKPEETEKPKRKRAAKAKPEADEIEQAK